MGKSHDLATGAAYQDQTESDTRYVNASGDTMTGNLAINNASGSQVTLHRSDTTIGNDDLYGQIIMSGDDADTNSSGTRGYIRGRSQGSGGGLKMEFGTAGGGVAMGSDPRMTINADGFVTIPNQPAFRAWAATIFSSVGVMAFPNVTQKGGTNYNTANGLFTCPIAGWYSFTFHYLTHSSGSRNDTYFEKNGSVGVEQRNYKSSGNHETHTLTQVDYFAANDTMGVRNVTGDVYAYDTWTRFSGFYLG